MERFMLLVKENVRLILGAVVVLVALFVLVIVILSRNTTLAKTKVDVNNKTFNVFIAKNDKDKQIGLSGRDKIGNDEGMIFVFDKPDFYSFWMKEMKFPIDIIYISNNRVTTIVRNAPPPSSDNNLRIYQPKQKSNMVLELNAGLAQKYNIQEGTPIKVENL